MNRSFDRLNCMMDSLIFLAYVNALWILFTLAGFIVLGFFPATTAMYAVFRKRVMGEESIKVFQLFWSTYRREFIKGNKLGFLLVVVAYLFYVEYVAIDWINHDLMNYFYYPIFTLNLVAVLVLCYLFPVSVHYDLSVFQIVKRAFLIMIWNPRNTLISIVGVVFIYYMLMTIPILTLFFGGSILAYFTTYMSNLSFGKVEQLVPK